MWASASSWVLVPARGSRPAFRKLLATDFPVERDVISTTGSGVGHRSDSPRASRAQRSQCRTVAVFPLPVGPIITRPLCRPEAVPAITVRLIAAMTSRCRLVSTYTSLSAMYASVRGPEGKLSFLCCFIVVYRIECVAVVAGFRVRVNVVCNVHGDHFGLALPEDFCLHTTQRA